MHPKAASSSSQLLQTSPPLLLPAAIDGLTTVSLPALCQRQYPARSTTHLTKTQYGDLLLGKGPTKPAFSLDWSKAAAADSLSKLSALSLIMHNGLGNVDVLWKVTWAVYAACSCLGCFEQRSTYFSVLGFSSSGQLDSANRQRVLFLFVDQYEFESGPEAHVFPFSVPLKALRTASYPFRPTATPPLSLSFVLPNQQRLSGVLAPQNLCHLQLDSKRSRLKLSNGVQPTVVIVTAPADCKPNIEASKEIRLIKFDITRRQSVRSGHVDVTGAKSMMLCSRNERRLLRCGSCTFASVLTSSDAIDRHLVDGAKRKRTGVFLKQVRY